MNPTDPEGALRTIRALSAMGRGVDEVLAHLFVGPKTLTQLRRAMLADMAKDASGELADERTREYLVNHSLLYDIGQLSTWNIVETVHGDLIQIDDFYREGVRLFLRVACPHGLPVGLRNELYQALREEGVPSAPPGPRP